MIAAIVLAAGTSTRMGEPKPLVRLDDEPLLGHVLRAVRASTVGRTIVVLGDSAAEVRSGVDLSDVEVVENPSFRDGMSSSLRVGVAALPADTDGFFVVLGDAPFVRSTTFDALIKAHRSIGARVVLPTYRGIRGNPVLLDRSLSDEAALITGDRGCREIHQRHPTETLEVPVDDPGVLVDLDTPEDVRIAREALRDHRPVAALVGTLSRASRRAPPEEAAGTLVVVGNSPVAESLVGLGRLVGFRVVAAGPDLDPGRFPDADELITDLDALAPRLGPDSYTVVATMSEYEGRALRLLARSPVPYIGWVARRRRATPLLAELAREGLAPDQLARIHNPAGIDLGARTTEEIALSVVAEVVKTARGRPASNAP